MSRSRGGVRKGSKSMEPWQLSGNRTKAHKACPDMEITGLAKFASISSPLAWDLDDYEASELKPISSFLVKLSFPVLLSVSSSQETLCSPHSWNMPLRCSEALLFTANIWWFLAYFSKRSCALETYITNSKMWY